MEINNDEFYSLMQVQKITQIRSRQYLAKYIRDGYLNAITLRAKGGSPRYAIKGEWVKSFLVRLKDGSMKKNKYTKEELKHMLDGAMEYCEKNNIKTLKELTKSIENLK